MISPYAPVKVDAQVLIDAVHGLQVDLSLLADWAARDPEPFLQARVPMLLEYLHDGLAHHMPFVRRH
jgi:hypothetical protein